jgi:hypothetical protein
MSKSTKPTKHVFAAAVLRLQRPPVLTVETRTDGAITIVQSPGTGDVGASTQTETGTNQGTGTVVDTQTNTGSEFQSGTSTGTNSQFTLNGQNPIVSRQVTSVNTSKVVPPGPPDLGFDVNGFTTVVDRNGQTVRENVTLADVTVTNIGGVRDTGLSLGTTSFIPDPNGDGTWIPPFPWPQNPWSGVVGNPDWWPPITGSGEGCDNDSDTDDSSDNSPDTDGGQDSDNSSDTDSDEDAVAREGIAVPFTKAITPPLAPPGLKAKPKKG